MSENILLVVYIFPPAPGIGGRRWAKFAKYFTRLGHNVHVICNAPKSKEISLWIDDVKDNPKIFVHGIPEKYPDVLTDIPKNIFEKIKYQIALNFVRKNTNGSLYDRSIFWKENFVNLADNVIAKHNMKNVFVTIAPMNHACNLIKLKAKYPDTKFVADFRDPWTSGKNYGFPQLEKLRAETEENNEALVCKKYDLVASSVRELCEILPNKHALENSKFYLLEHAIDEDDFSEIENNRDPNFCKIIYNGNLYEGVKNEFDIIFKTLKNIPNKNYNLSFYIPTLKPEYYEFAEGLEGYVKVNKALAPKKFFKEMSNSNFVVIVYPEKNADYFTTKFVEIIYLKIPIIFICKTGYVSNFIEENRLGIFITKNEIATKLPQLIATNKMENYNSNFDISKYLYPTITKQLVERVNVL